MKDLEKLKELYGRVETVFQRHYCNSVIILMSIENAINGTKELTDSTYRNYCILLNFIENLPEELSVYSVDKDMNIVIKTCSHSDKEIQVSIENNSYDQQPQYKITYREVVDHYFMDMNNALNDIKEKYELY